MVNSWLRLGNQWLTMIENSVGYLHVNSGRPRFVHHLGEGIKSHLGEEDEHFEQIGSSQWKLHYLSLHLGHWRGHWRGSVLGSRRPLRLESARPRPAML